MTFPWELLLLFFIVAFLYSSVGHGGASGYLALFALFGIATPAIAPVALTLNIIVAGTSFWQFRRGGYFSWSMLWPFVATSIPAAFIGGFIPVPQSLFSFILGVALLLAAARIFFLTTPQKLEATRNVPLSWSLLLGGGLGALSGMIGIGGGVFLSPIVLLARWADVQKTAALSSAFIVLNSLSGLAGHLSRSHGDMEGLAPLVGAVLLGGAVGSHMGAFAFQPRILQGVLGLVLLVAGAKLVGKLLFGVP
jgi:uncharacterized protein